MNHFIVKSSELVTLTSEVMDPEMCLKNAQNIGKTM